MASLLTFQSLTLSLFDKVLITILPNKTSTENHIGLRIERNALARCKRNTQTYPGLTQLLSKLQS